MPRLRLEVPDFGVTAIRHRWLRRLGLSLRSGQAAGSTVGGCGSPQSRRIAPSYRRRDSPASHCSCAREIPPSQLASFPRSSLSVAASPHALRVGRAIGTDRGGKEVKLRSAFRYYGNELPRRGDDRLWTQSGRLQLGGGQVLGANEITPRVRLLLFIVEKYFIPMY